MCRAYGEGDKRYVRICADAARPGRPRGTRIHVPADYDPPTHLTGQAIDKLQREGYGQKVKDP